MFQRAVGRYGAALGVAMKAEQRRRSLPREGPENLPPSALEVGVAEGERTTATLVSADSLITRHKSPAAYRRMRDCSPKFWASDTLGNDAN